jgi:hypothetical protein
MSPSMDAQHDDDGDDVVGSPPVSGVIAER